jgi:ribonuclease BN (tRNA processing enzyme)
VSIHVNDHVVMLDAGTGARSLGTTLAGTAHSITVVFTHLHTDHVAGFPFFAPLFEAQRSITLVPYRSSVEAASPLWTPLDLMDGVHFPVLATEIPARCHTTPGSPEAALARCGLKVARLPVNHPGGAWGYRISHQNRTFVFIPDNELSAPSPTVAPEDVAAFCQGADVLCHDAQYVAAEREARRGWGHSVVADVCALARSAQVDHLVLFHHDPDRSDAALDRIQARARRLLQPDQISCTAAYEGLTLSL